MTYDGKALSRARKTIHERRQRNEAELKRRRGEVYSLDSEFERLDAEMIQLMTELALSALKRGENAGVTVRNAKDRSREIIGRRGELLREYGRSDDYLDEIHDCEACLDTGYVEGRECSCLEEAYSLEMSRQLTSMLNIGSQCFEKFDLRLYEPGGGAKSADKVREEMSGVFESCRGFAVHFGEHTDNLLFQGGTGLGKTFLSACVAKTVSEKGFSVVYDTCISVIDAFETQKFDRNAENSAEISSQIKRYLGCDLLIFDDLGTEMTTVFTQSTLYTLINTRLIGGKQTIISTNLSDEELERRYTPQIVSRIRGEYEVLQFVGRDIRAVKKERGL